ncbi:hypothetical protein EDM52_16765 [Brevibacillus invocatus]|uniref:Uncharacterized protein n=1 Tax=Brevibacillus invocatus TaxID=173959 RepID=A0A3M8C6X8_9BACL|nr:hypothetical protein EDM52_16765 [Brevibacillus invocatus]
MRALPGRKRDSSVKQRISFFFFSVKNVSTFFIKQDVTACGLQINGHDRLFAYGTICIPFVKTFC